MSVASTALTEGSAPTAVALTISTVSVSSGQYGNLVAITDIAKIKSPIDIVGAASERLSWNARLTIDQVTRDTIALSGTPYMQGANVVRTDIASTEVLTATDLRKLRGKMYGKSIPRFADGHYRIFVHPNVAYDLRSDTGTGAFIDVASSWRRNTENSGNALAA